MIDFDWKHLAQWALSVLGALAMLLFGWHHRRLIALEERVIAGEKKQIEGFAALKAEVLEAMRVGFTAETEARETSRLNREAAERREREAREESSRRLHVRLDGIGVQMSKQMSKVAEDVAHIRGRLDGRQEMAAR